MCGISGIVSFTPSDKFVSEIKLMTDSIRHRGPDGEGHWIDEKNQVALGHRRLSIIDLSEKGKQPMHYLDRYTITFNGEIYNYIELKQQLTEAGYSFTSDTDTEVLLALFDQKKEACLQDLDGMFSFAIWDAKDETLFCARDRFGEKPFHYCFHDNQFYFASEMKALWAASIPKKKNDRLFTHFEKTGSVHLPENINETFYEAIWRLEHGHWMKVKPDGSHEIQKYYDIDWKKQDCKLNFQDACIEFNRLFQLSLTRRFRSDVPVGTSLSGGLDSSSIVCNMKPYAHQQQVTPLTFSARFKDFKKDEGYFIEKVIEKTGFESYNTWPTGMEMASDIEQLCFHQEEPFGSASIYAQYRVQLLAKEKNVTVLIDGQGADEILAGYINYYSDYLQSLFHEKPFFSRKRIKEQHRFIDFHTPHTGLKKALIKRLNYYEVKGKIKPNKAVKRLNEHLYNSTMRGPLQDLLRYADRNSMAHSREIRLPFLFHELVEFCFSLPDEFKLKLGWTKYIMRVTFEEVLPEEICWRKEKVGFEPPQNEWLENAGINASWRSYLLNKFE
ncbi:asparagine synthase (glutamine-hydrolyzing) [Fluviicola taffensis]|uniref:asparagine synthase (glutamine-hydrolyzing) n=1 Tax=Fluviicola taffensis (strain DSM 16823 / NCIMB 13979 / RW262) TaxID=755732 RepID=F2II28_FLUTR|nr:asparagine synthase (glutamine-hydrolyzing) [Fluviicola taffensis]AEA42728.1 asparagine synthase (glutamine-hydrolyzing) [Fluviicola taffensis DSM 16823]